MVLLIRPALSTDCTVTVISERLGHDGGTIRAQDVRPSATNSNCMLRVSTAP
jgi:hypothetical protein